MTEQGGGARGEEASNKKLRRAVREIVAAKLLLWHIAFLLPLPMMLYSCSIPLRSMSNTHHS